MIALIKNLFSISSARQTQADSKIDGILERIKQGKAKSLLVRTTDIGYFETRVPIFQKFMYEIVDFLRLLEKKYGVSLSVRLSNVLNLPTWI